MLHDVLRHVGLLRLNRGVVTPIRAAADDVEVDAALVARLHPMLGRWSAEGEPLTEDDVGMALVGIRRLLEGLDLVAGDLREWRPGPSARWLFPRATALADLWGARR